MISQAIYEILYADASVKGVVSNRIYPNTAQQGDVLPYIVYTKVSKLPTDVKDSGTGFDKTRIQVDCYHTTYANCEVLAGYVRTAMDRVKGSYGSMTILQIVFLDENDMPLVFQEDSDKVYQIAVDFMIITK